MSVEKRSIAQKQARPFGLRGKWRHAALRDLARELHYLCPAPAERRPAMAPFGAATRLATKREQTLEHALHDVVALDQAVIQRSADMPEHKQNGEPGQR